MENHQEIRKGIFRNGKYEISNVPYRVDKESIGRDVLYLTSDDLRGIAYIIKTLEDSGELTYNYEEVI